MYESQREVDNSCSDRRRVTAPQVVAMKRSARKIVMITAYDALFAKLVDRAGVDLILVGDSVAPVLAGEETTLPATVGQMIYHGRIVQRGTSRALVVVDLPFLSYQVSVTEAVRNGGRILKSTGAGAIKLEGGRRWAETVQALVGAGIPVMGHIGFTPQSVHLIGGIDVQGSEGMAGERLIEDALALQAAGAFAIVLEFLPASVAQRVTESLAIPTIGIGAGPHCDGQVLVLHEMLGLTEHLNRGSKRYAELRLAVSAAVESFGNEVRGGLYQDHTRDSQ